MICFIAQCVCAKKNPDRDDCALYFGPIICTRTILIHMHMWCVLLLLMCVIHRRCRRRRRFWQQRFSTLIWLAFIFFFFSSESRNMSTLTNLYQLWHAFLSQLKAFHLNKYKVVLILRKHFAFIWCDHNNRVIVIFVSKYKRNAFFLVRNIYTSAEIKRKKRNFYVGNGLRNAHRWIHQPWYWRRLCSNINLQLGRKRQMLMPEAHLQLVRIINLFTRTSDQKRERKKNDSHTHSMRTHARVRIQLSTHSTPSL